MIQSFLRLKLFKSPTTFSCVNPNRLCNTSKSSYQQPTGYFDISDELVDNLTNQKKKLKVESANKDKEVKTRHCFASRTKLIEKFKECFECSDEQAETLTENNKQLMLVTLSKVTENIEILFKNKVTVRTILDNSWLLSLPKGEFVSCVSRI